MSSLFAAIRWRWIAIGLIAYLLFLLLTAPAALLVKRLQTHGIMANGVSGTVWNGRAASIQLRGQAVGATQWRIQAAKLLMGQLTVELKTKREDGFMEGTVTAHLGGRIRLTDTRMALPIPVLSSLAGMHGGMLSGWQGNIHAQLGELVIEEGWPTQIIGNVEAVELVGPARQPTAIGSYRVEFAAAPNPTTEIQGSLSSREDAPLDVIGVVRLLPNRQYVIDAQVGTRNDAPASIGKALEYLGPADAQGRRPLSLAGSI
jgi:general secretion pathway protein N